jgi:hypothetical protein
MAMIHPVFCRRVGKDKVMVFTVLDKESLGLTDKDVDTFFVATTERNIITGLNNATIVIDMKTKTASDKYVKIVNESNPGAWLEETKGMGLSGIATGAYWFLKKTRSLMEQLYGT